MAYNILEITKSPHIFSALFTIWEVWVHKNHIFNMELCKCTVKFRTIFNCMIHMNELRADPKTCRISKCKGERFREYLRWNWSLKSLTYYRLHLDIPSVNKTRFTFFDLFLFPLPWVFTTFLIFHQQESKYSKCLCLGMQEWCINLFSFLCVCFLWYRP